MPLGSTSIERSRRAIFSPVCLAATRPCRFFFGTDSTSQTSDQPKDSSCAESDLLTTSASDPEVLGQNEGTSDAVASRSIAASTESDKAGVVRWMPSKLVVQKIIQQKERSDAMAKFKEDTRARFRLKLRMKFELGVEEIDVQNLVDFFDVNTPESLKQEGVKVVVPSTAVPTLLVDVDHSIWRIKHRTGCRIELLGTRELEPETRTLQLSGLEHEIARAWEELSKIVAKCTKHYTLPPAVANTKYSNTHHLPDKELGEGQSPVSVRTVLTENWGYLTQDFDAIEEPEEWTKSTFERYVLCLVRSNNKKRERYDDRVRNRLIALFEDPQLDHVISTAAVNTAMTYFLGVVEFKEVRRLFVRMEMIGVELEIETFNIMLREAARSQDLHNFAFLVGLIAKRGLRPDAGTWLALLNVVADFPTQSRIIALMYRKGFTEQPWFVQRMLRVLAPFETQWSLLREDSHEDFVAHLDRRYGTQWLSTSCANRILHDLAAHGLYSRCHSFVQLMQVRMVEADALSISSVIRHCRWQGNVPAAIETVAFFSRLCDVARGPDTYEALFYLATERCLASVARVVWLYACLDGATTFRMRWQVKKWSGHSNWRPNVDWDTITAPRAAGPKEVWQHTVGKLVIGSGLGHALFRAARPAASAPPPPPPPSLPPSPALRPRRPVDARQMKALIAAQIDADVKSDGACRPSRSFDAMLREALRRDDEWARDRAWSRRSLRWLFENTVKVPVVPRNTSKETLRDDECWLL